MHCGKNKKWPEEKTVLIFNITCLIKGINTVYNHLHTTAHASQIYWPINITGQSVLPTKLLYDLDLVPS